METQTNETTNPTSAREEMRVRGAQLLDKVNEIIAAGNVRKVIVKHDGKTIVEIPLTIGLIGTLLAPQVAALGAIAALVTECSIEVVRTDVPPGAL